MHHSTNNESLKTMRIKNYFLDAARQIIIKDGVAFVTVRRIAEISGYSYASIYNYFADINELLQEVKAMMITDVQNHMGSHAMQEVFDLDDIKRINHIYIDYYFERPHIFQFFYSYKFDSKSDSGIPDFEQSWNHTYKAFVENGTLKQTDVAIVAKTIIYAIHGMLTLYFSNNGITKKMLYEDIDQITEYILKERG